MEEDTVLKNKTKVEVAAAVRAAYSTSEGEGILEPVLDRILTNPKSVSDVDDEETLEWCQWLIAGGSTPDEFTQTVKLYDKATTCGLVWTENFVAYRCRTCGISPYLSLCTDCFHKGNHEGHDFIVFRSETGGACDCGEINVIKESGCCVLHGPRGTAAMQRAQILAGRSGSGGQSSNDPSAPSELLSIANGMMPRLFHRLIAFLRAVEARKLARAQQISKNNTNKNNKGHKPKATSPQPVSLAATAAAMIANPAVSAPPKGHKFIKLLQGFSDMGVAMRQVMTSALIDPTMYKVLCGSVSPEYERLGLKIPEHHQTFLEELVYWTVKREFPEDLVCFLLSLRSDSSYNEAFARAFITHYELISQSILKSSDPERLCKHIAAVSVQLFSKEKLAIAMVEQMQLLHLLLRSLYDMIKSTAVPLSAFPVLRSSSSVATSLSSSNSSKTIALAKNAEASVNDIFNEDVLYDSARIEDNNRGGSGGVSFKVIDCDNDIIKNNYYWLIKSDLKELLSHDPVATKFFNDQALLATWFDFLTLLQGMNVNKYVGKGEPHVEHESESYVGAFMAELVISATLMWTLVSHLKDGSSRDITLNFIRLTRKQLNEWYRQVRYSKGTISFHLPLHRYLSTFINQGLRCQGIQLEELLPPENELELIIQQLVRLQTAYYGISTRLWARNGPSLVNQAEYYVSSLCCNSMIDADLFMLQIAAVRKSSSVDAFMKILLEEFGVVNMLSIQKCFSENNTANGGSGVDSVGSMIGAINSDELEPEEQMTMLENLMIFLATLTTVRTNLGIADKDLMALEMSVLLCKSDKLHSELMELLPERCGNDAQQKNFELVLAEIADFQAPRNMQQGIFTPKARVWEEIYDPIYTLLRSSNRADYQSSRDRYQDYISRSKKDINSKNLWPPFRLPSFKPEFVNDPAKLLLSKTFLEVAFIILYHGVHTGVFSELVISLCVYLLEIAVHSADNEEELIGFLTEIPVPGTNFGGLRRDGQRECESITSLLMQLYTKLSGESKVYSLKPEVEDVEFDTSHFELRIGDGPFFVAKVLDKLTEKCSTGRHYVQNEINKHQMDQSSISKQELSMEEKEREEKRRKAKERKLHLMNEYAMKRQQFMSDSQSQSEEIDVSDMGVNSPLGEGPSSMYERFQDHECVICMEKLESKPNNPFGLMTYLSPCNILEYQRLHSPDRIGPFLKTIHKETLEEFLKFYEDSSVIQHIPLDPGFGVQVQSCGHFIHQDCFTSYMNYVKKAPPPPPSSTSANKSVISFTYKEYSCPLCRQLGNSFLPMIFNTTTTKENQMSGSFTEISKLIKKRQKCTLSNSETTAVESFIKDINACAMNNFQPAMIKLLQKNDSTSPLVSAFLLTSHLRQFINQQLKLNDNIGGTVSSSSSSSTTSTKKLSPLLPILSVIKQRYKTLPVGYVRKLAQNWEMICGKRSSKGNGEVPTLLRDVETELFHFILDLPILDRGGTTGLQIFNGIVQALYNLRVVQVLTAIGSQFSDVECHEILRVYSQSQSMIEKILSCVLRNILNVKCEPPAPPTDDLMNADENGNHKNFEIPETMFIENLTQSLLVPFLKTVAYLKSEIFGDAYPISNIDGESFASLVEYLKLGSVSNGEAFSLRGNNGERSCAELLYWRQSEGEESLDWEVVIENWCSELMQSIRLEKGSSSEDQHDNDKKSHQAVELLKSHLYIYDKPSLVKLPTEYDTIFENYRKIKCQKCDSIPSSPALCLICGDMLCLNELCCFDLELEVSEVVAHCQKKCGRTGLFLSIMTSEILIVREKEACIWGSIFLDSFCEEDLELKRGKPLFLCQERLDILQRNWIAQSFYKSELKWFQHENFL